MGGAQPEALSRLSSLTERRRWASWKPNITGYMLYLAGKSGLTDGETVFKHEVYYSFEAWLEEWGKKGGKGTCPGGVFGRWEVALYGASKRGRRDR
jgi:hypothetical protein